MGQFGLCRESCFESVIANLNGITVSEPILGERFAMTEDVQRLFADVREVESEKA